MVNEPINALRNEFPRLDRIRQRLAPLREALLRHPIYGAINNVPALRFFMEHHVFAVWDFMSLLKSLQARLCCVGVPWLPAADPRNTRFINEIVLAEESDEDGHGGFLSHFELYVRAMTQCRADTSRMNSFLGEIGNGTSVLDALEAVGAPAYVRRFVGQTFDTIERGSVWSMVSTFTFGREDLLPAVFQRIVDELNEEAGGALEDFRYYLRRHIGLDSGEHGPMALRLVASACDNDETRWRDAEEAASAALEARLNLWDAVFAALTERTRGPG